MDNDQPETIPEPEAITKTREIIAKLTEWVDGGEVEAVSIYVALRNGNYRNMQTGPVGRHEDAGRILELAMIRLGFVQRDLVEDMIDGRS